MIDQHLFCWDVDFLSFFLSGLLALLGEYLVVSKQVSG
jgi:hypothetical protein